MAYRHLNAQGGLRKCSFKEHPSPVITPRVRDAVMQVIGIGMVRLRRRDGSGCHAAKTRIHPSALTPVSRPLSTHLRPLAVHAQYVTVTFWRRGAGRDNPCKTGTFDRSGRGCHAARSTVTEMRRRLARATIGRLRMTDDDSLDGVDYPR